MTIFIGDTPINDVFIGDVPVIKIMYGNNVIWEKSSQRSVQESDEIEEGYNNE